MRIQLLGRFPLRRPELAADYVEDDRSLVLDARFLRWASPLELAAMVSLGAGAAHQGREVVLQLPYDEDVASYLERMNVLDLLTSIAKIDGTPLTQARTDCSGKLLEVTQVTKANADEVADRLGQMAITRLERKVGIAAFKSLGELIGNATTHGTSSTGAFTAAQIYTGTSTGRPGFEFAVCDAGVGIFDHLRASVRHQDLVDSRDALERALTNGITGTPDGRGYGLGDLGDHATRDGAGRLMLRSGGAVISVVLRNQRKIDCRSVANTVDGTWAWLRVRVP